jgi:glycerophosphoryl diester phosphodiesterase
MNMITVAHRGYTRDGLYKDNSLDAFRSAFAAGFDMVEMDVQLCKSGTIVILHDVIHSPNRCVWELDESELAQDGIATLANFFSAVYTPGMRIMLDVKGKGDGIVAALLCELAANVPPEHAPRVYVGSFSKPVVEELANSGCTYRVGLITSNSFRKHDMCGLDFLSMDLNMLLGTEDATEYRDLELFAYTCQSQLDVDMAGRISALTGLISDVPVLPT